MASYARMNALMYAGAFFNRVCSDGKVALKTGYPAKINGVKLKPGLPHAEIGDFMDVDDDCTHFISCCIGQTQGTINVGDLDFTIKGGGMKVPRPFAQWGVYGETHVTRMYYFAITHGAKIVGPEFRDTGDPETRVAITANLQPGDLLIYSKGTHIRYHAHCVMLVSATFITCHTRSRFGSDFSDVKLPFLTLLRMPG